MSMNDSWRGGKFVFDFFRNRDFRVRRLPPVYGAEVLQTAVQVRVKMGRKPKSDLDKSAIFLVSQDRFKVLLLGFKFGGNLWCHF